MRTVKAAQIAVEQTTVGFDKLFDYLIPFDMAEVALPGKRVLVPFGKGNRKRQGMILRLIEKEQSQVSLLKPIVSVLDKAPLLSPEMLALAEYIKEQCFCTYFDALRPMLPAGANMRIVASYRAGDHLENLDVSALSEEERRIVSHLQAAGPGAAVKRDRLLEIMGLASDSELPEKLVAGGFLVRTDDAVRRVGDATIRMVQLCQATDLPLDKLTPKQKSVVSLLEETGSASVKEICYFTGVTPAVVNALAKKGVLSFFDNEVYRTPYQTQSPRNTSEVVLSEEQQAAYEGLARLLAEKTGESALLYGVTGSGKTQVFLKLIDDALQTEGGVIVMVPEISLTPQTISIFQGRYGSDVAVFHSAMSLGQRMDEWKRIKNHDARIAIGTRSAAFAPFDKLSLIIMDEEQEHTYKSESSPRYHARDVARFRAKYHKGLFVMASATPSVETYCKAKAGQYPLFALKNRYGAAKLPQVTAVNMRREMADGNFSPLSRELVASLEETLESGHQSILLLNRRGHHIFVSCKSCGQVKTCPNCSISLTYHSANNRLMCHYCGHSEPFSEVCDVCGERQIRSSGYGTQKVEEELHTLFPDARILRMDADTTMTRFSHEKHLTAFQKGEYDIMIGTQMVAKGLDFPKVTLVGVINADQSLYSDDFKSAEKTFSLLTQVVGRSGRGGDAGRAIIQSITPESAIIKLAAGQDYDAFYETEILSRKLMIYPPYCDLCVVGFSGEDRNLTYAVANAFFNALRQALQGEYRDLKLIVLGPSPSSVPKVNQKYRYRLIIKCKSTRRLRQFISGLLITIGNQRQYKHVSVFADINPENIL